MVNTVLVTGSNGFIGKNFVSWILKNTDWNVIGLDRRQSDLEDPRYKQYQMDLNNLLDIPDKFEYVVHFAAEKNVKNSFKTIDPYILNNVLGTAKLFDWLRNKECKKIINFSTVAVLGPIQDGQKKWENAAINPHNPYAGSKAAQEAVALAYRNTYHMPIYIVRIDTPFGQFQPDDNFIPHIIKNAGKNLELYGTTNWAGNFEYSKRTWTYVQDICAELYMLLSKNLFSQHIWHISGTNCSVKEMAKKIHTTLDKELIFKDKEIDTTSYNQDVQLEYGISSSHYFTRVSNIDNSLKETIDWYTNSSDKK
jgi:dTDP-glucose 4,6-dehydratase